MNTRRSYGAVGSVRTGRPSLSPNDEQVYVVQQGESFRATTGRFEALVAEWRRETGGWSNPHKIVAHRCYRAIIAMGWNAVPLLLADLDQSADPDLWGPALREITGATVTIAPGDVGRLDAVAKAWLSLAETKGWLGSRVKAA